MSRYGMQKTLWKYNAKKTVVDGITFDSKKEARRYVVLKEMEARGEISDLRLQPEYELIPAFRKNGKKYRETVYRADFVYEQGGQIVVEDVKGCRTAIYMLKRKLFEYTYKDLTIKET